MGVLVRKLDNMNLKIIILIIITGNRYNYNLRMHAEKAALNFLPLVEEAVVKQRKI